MQINRFAGVMLIESPDFTRICLETGDSVSGSATPPFSMAVKVIQADRPPAVYLDVTPSGQPSGLESAQAPDLATVAAAADACATR